MTTFLKTFALGLVFCIGSAVAQDEMPDYTENGADTCLRCHDEGGEVPVMDIFKTRHGHRGDSRSPFGGGLQCESCHGPGAQHAGRVRRGQERPPPLYNGPHSPASVEENNAICLGCHEGGMTHNWASSVHADNEVACSSCHSIHAEHDRMRSAATQNETCYGCHAGQRADAHKASVHPLRFGEMACSDCHQPHDSVNEFSLVERTVNETCYTCHAEKRGPFLWEHAPVDEDCGNCHQPHGSNHPALLTRRQPLLCQQCHSRGGHTSLPFTSDDLPGQGSNLTAFVVSQGCGNCHSQVHGSNHPSGVNLTR